MAIRLYNIATNPATFTELDPTDAADIPDGSIAFYADGTDDPTELFISQLMAEISPGPVGQLVATATYGVDTYPPAPGVAVIAPAWVLDSDAPTSITLENLGTNTDALMNLGLPKRLTDRHFGYLVECKIDDTVFHGEAMLIGNLAGVDVKIPASEYMTANDESDIRVIISKNSDNEDTLLVLNYTNQIVIAADDPVITFEVSLLIG